MAEAVAMAVAVAVAAVGLCSGCINVSFFIFSISFFLFTAMAATATPVHFPFLLHRLLLHLLTFFIVILHYEFIRQTNLNH